jgi:hypothetical protein
MRSQQFCSVLLSLAVVACKTADRRPAFADSAAVSPAAGMKLEAMPMLPALRAHTDSLAARPGMMRNDMPQHQAEVKHVVAAIHADMARLGMPSDPAYDALADSVVNGSAALGTAGGPEFERLVARHVDQLRRLAAVYETKVAAMK